MCDFDCANLIDLTLEDDIPCSTTQIKTETATQPSELPPIVGPLFISPNRRKRDSLENNPFDCVQKLTQRQDDPFDIVEREACLKAQQSAKPSAEVKLGNLLSLSDDNVLDEDLMPLQTINEDENCKNMAKAADIESESPPVLLNEKLLVDSASDTDSNPNSSAESSSASKLKKALEYRNRLLKLSLSNAAFNSPAARKNSLDVDGQLSTPVSSMFSRAAVFGEHLLASESPLKLIEDDIMSEEPPNFLESEKNFEADLEMLKIPILNELHSPSVEHDLVYPDTKTPESNIQSSTSLATSLSNLEAIKAKLKAKREETNNNHQLEITSLIHNLKSLIASGEMPNNVKKQQASDLLESLSSALSTTNPEETLKPQDLLALPPQPIKRQGTFDIELQENEERIEDQQPLIQEMPNCMISSSATYDGETAEEKQDLNLPEIAPISPNLSPHQHNSHTRDHLQSDVNDIMEQLSKLLINNSSSSENHQNTNNPTFIVVMNANNNVHSNGAAAKQRSAMVASYMQNSFNDGSPDLSKENPLTRRRSQSLSIHDKIKIVQLPLQPPTPRSIKKQQHIDLDDSPPVTTPPAADMETPEFKTPSRMIRRNSYSSGTPYTAQVGVRRTGFGCDGKTAAHLRKAQTLDTHHEGQHHQQQQQAIVRPMSMPANNLPTFKPDLKKKLKHNTESIMKSTAPLKATIPIKKVAPMLKSSPPTPDHSNKLTGQHNSSLQLQTKTVKMPTTPMPAKGKSTLSVGYPNACSTPAGFTSPMKRTGGPLNKPRYSYMSATPNPRTASTSASVAGLKRRTITEFKAKSPLKPKVSSVGLAAAAAAASTSTRTTTGNSRLSTSAGARISKTPAKPTSNTATVKPTSRLSSRISVGGSALTNRNKENKRP